MRIERLSFADDPEKITAASFDCIWVHLAPRTEPRPLTSRALQWLDWKMQGQISRFLTEPREGKSTTFVPTMKRIHVPYIALDSSGRPDWPALLKNCHGMKLRSVFYFCEEPGRLLDAERELRQHVSEGFPETIAFGSDAAPGDKG